MKCEIIMLRLSEEDDKYDYDQEEADRPKLNYTTANQSTCRCRCRFCCCYFIVSNQSSTSTFSNLFIMLNACTLPLFVAYLFVYGQLAGSDSSSLIHLYVSLTPFFPIESNEPKKERERQCNMCE